MGFLIVFMVVIWGFWIMPKKPEPTPQPVETHVSFGRPGAADIEIGKCRVTVNTVKKTYDSFCTEGK